MDYRELFKAVHTRTGMFLQNERYDEVAAFVLGCDAGNDWGLLQGFREWLIVRLRRISERYTTWLRAQEWYDEKLDR